ncbi:MAG: hypothetical protein ABI843_15980 [Dokdonella sp.]
MTIANDIRATRALQLAEATIAEVDAFLATVEKRAAEKSILAVTASMPCRSLADSGSDDLPPRAA